MGARSWNVEKTVCVDVEYGSDFCVADAPCGSCRLCNMLSANNFVQSLASD